MRREAPPERWRARRRFAPHPTSAHGTISNDLCGSFLDVSFKIDQNAFEVRSKMKPKISIFIIFQLLCPNWSKSIWGPIKKETQNQSFFQKWSKRVWKKRHKIAICIFFESFFQKWSKRVWLIKNASQFHQKSLCDTKRSSGSMYSTPNASRFHQKSLRDSKRSSGSTHTTPNASKNHQKPKVSLRLLQIALQMSKKLTLKRDRQTTFLVDSMKIASLRDATRWTKTYAEWEQSGTPDYLVPNNKLSRLWSHSKPTWNSLYFKMLKNANLSRTFKNIFVWNLIQNNVWMHFFHVFWMICFSFLESNLDIRDCHMTKWWRSAGHIRHKGIVRWWQTADYNQGRRQDSRLKAKSKSTFKKQNTFGLHEIGFNENF